MGLATTTMSNNNLVLVLVLAAVLLTATATAATRIPVRDDRAIYTNNNHHNNHNNNNNKVPDIWMPWAYNKTVVDKFNQKVCTNPISMPDYDPYNNKTLTPSPWGENAVCGVKYENETNRIRYSLHTYNSSSEAAQAGAHVTHVRPCGACSTLRDMAVYMGSLDLTGPTRKCAFKAIISKKWAIKCLHDIGFTEQCSIIWYYNTVNSRKHCFGICIKYLHSPYNDPPGSDKLNPCLQCDEDKSGPVFKRWSGRTRRDSGLLSAIRRPPKSIAHVIHDYY